MATIGGGETGGEESMGSTPMPDPSAANVTGENGDDIDNDEDWRASSTALSRRTAELLAQGGIPPPEDDQQLVTEEAAAEDAELVVLDPDHPLMMRFQGALKAHLGDQKEKITLELREIEEAVKRSKKQREDVGVELYKQQQELARTQLLLEQRHEDLDNISKVRSEQEQLLDDTRREYLRSQDYFTKERQQLAQLTAEVENLHLRLFYMRNAQQDVSSDLTIMKRAAEKANTELTRAEHDKQQQDLLVERLVGTAERLREEVAMLEAQLAAQKDDTVAAKSAATEAQTEIEIVSVEKKQLMQQWSNCLVGMRRRDEAHAALMEALNDQRQQILSAEGELAALRRAIQSEEDMNEQLTRRHNKTENEGNVLRRQLQQCKAKMDVLNQEYSTYQRMLNETERQLDSVNNDKSSKLLEVDILRKQIEKEDRERVKLNQNIWETLMAKLTQEKAAKYAGKLLGSARDRQKEMEQQEADLYNSIAKRDLDKTRVTARIEVNDKELRGLDQNIRQDSDIIAKSEVETGRKMLLVEQKQAQIDQLNKKLDALITQRGGEELGPLEFEIKSLEKSIGGRDNEIAEMKRNWLRQQNQLVKMLQESSEQNEEVARLRGQMAVLTKRKVRTEGTIDVEKSEIEKVNRLIANLRHDITKLNAKIFRERDLEESKLRNNTLLEGDFANALKEAEHEALRLQQKLEDLKVEKETVLNRLVEAEQQIMLWERKIQLAKEMRAAVDTDIGEGEIRAMKFEIHRMEVRYTQLRLQQEKMTQELENTVTRRETIVTRADAASKMSGKGGVVVVTRSTMERQAQEIRKRIRRTQVESEECQQAYQALRSDRDALAAELSSRDRAVRELQAEIDTADQQLVEMTSMKQQGLQEILRLQQRVKYLEQVKDGKYKRSCPRDSGLPDELKKQSDRTAAIRSVVTKLTSSFGYMRGPLGKAIGLLDSETGRTTPMMPMSPQGSDVQA